MEWMDAFERWAPGVGPHRIEEALYNVSLQLILVGGDWGFATLCPVRALAPDGTVWFSDVRTYLSFSYTCGNFNRQSNKRL